MRLYDVFLSIHAEDFAAQSDWWARFLGRQWDRAPMPSCHEWSLTGDILFQVLDSSDGYGGATVTLHVADLDAEIARLGPGSRHPQTARGGAIRLRPCPGVPIRCRSGQNALATVSLKFRPVARRPGLISGVR